MPIHESSHFESEEVLKLLREIKRSPALTQRELSNRLGISLGKVNFLLKSLIRKGLVTAHNFKNSHNKKAYLYKLTPHGIEEKARVTYRFLKRKIKEYERLESEIKQLRQEVGDLGGSVDFEDRK
ncbi:MAG TPA: MarR family EPS-associated transcriptional regulator [Syntrophales bacterium]|nr:MarR family EPS-associated transcriptional regulator [Syntrophales bacterium]HOX93652.1 MarR family EPS-associated transcriptional regulator [Syntrophales bacterium]HPI57386.1 MarR family EPS-associated transcriptional regulator [Syntrophales bacterium]HPN25450.1 MarR family EPS-associated transcriptional regulator [Syntrophales bacterium]HQM29932.1 MarR family EPS-associated transcriptional regulator [Syntrophales bacterium]